MKNSLFKHHIDNTLCKVNKGISAIKKLRHALPRISFLTIYIVFLRSLIDYGDIIYDQPHNSSFCETLESVQYKAALAITGAIQGTSCKKIFQELGFESLKSRRWFRRLCCIFKIMKNEAPNYLISLIPKCEQTFNTRNKHLPTYNCRTDCFTYSFFPCTWNDWFNLDVSVRNSESISIFKSKLLSFILLVQNNILDIFDPQGLKLLTRLRLGFSHLNKHKFRHFQECMNQVCSCSLEIKDTSHCLLHCHHFTLHCIDLMNSVKCICNHCGSTINNNKNMEAPVLMKTKIKYIKTTERFSGSFFE